ncbi:hypothetical protein IQ250_20885 [Pseudanabaenaceae cyanobacterium LEGE 13415]|nr:hypothetical protein [Pseudanabaenaceae cyanobacterium LEGE 13415]
MWVTVGTYTLSKSWLFTPAVSGVWFRIQHSQPPLGRKGLIAQASAYAPVELNGIKRLWAKRETDLYQFIQPECWSDRVIALRGVPYDVEGAIDWTVTLDVWQGSNDSVSELSSQIAELKSLIELML